MKIYDVVINVPVTTQTYVVMRLEALSAKEATKVVESMIPWRTLTTQPPTPVPLTDVNVIFDNEGCSVVSAKEVISNFATQRIWTRSEIEHELEIDANDHQLEATSAAGGAI